MTDSFSNMEESFKNAFEHWDAPHSPAEMNAGWNQVASHLPQVPGAHAGSAGHAAGHIAAGTGKIIGFAGLGAAIVASSVILYNIYVKPAKTTTDDIGSAPAKTEQSKTNDNQVKTENQNTINLNQANTKTETNKHADPSSIASSGNNGGNDNSQSASPFIPPFVQNQNVNDGLTQNNNNNNNSVSSNSSNQAPAQKNQIPGMKLFLSDTVVCVGMPVASSSNMSVPNVVIEWGDGNWNYFSGQNIHKYTRAGVFRAHLTIDSYRVDRMVTVLETPKAKFTANQNDNFYVNVDNHSQNAGSYIWNFGDGTGDVNGFFARHTYTDSGRYKMRLIAMNQSGCADTSYQYVTVQHLVVPEISRNIITPNGDGKDDDVGVNIEGEYSVEFTIFDANSNKVFQTTNKNVHWNGKNQITGEDCKAGTYFYAILYSFRQNGDIRRKSGAITLKR